MKKLYTAILLFALVQGSSALAADESIGEIISAPCVACHGVAGAEPISNYPILAGQNEQYLLYVLRAYKSKKRNNAVMVGQLADFSNRDLENLAAYFASQPSPLQ